MKISANRDDLLKPLQQVVGVVERRQTLPILANVLISAKDNGLSLTATDLEVELKTHAKVQCSGEIEFTLPARKLLDICKALPESADLSLEIEGGAAFWSRAIHTGHVTRAGLPKYRTKPSQ